MRKSTRRKLKVYAVDAAMILLATQVTVVLKAANKAEASTYIPMQAIQDEYTGTRSDMEIGTLENNKEDISTSEDEWNWSNKDSDILLRIAMAEAEGEGTKGKALVMLVVMNRVLDDEFPDTIKEVIFQKGQFSPISNGRYNRVEPNRDCYEALRLIRDKGWDGSEGATYFESRSNSTWHSEHLTFLFRHGRHYFYKE